MIGSWLTRVATSWLVYRLTKSAWSLGLVGFAGQVPTFVLAPLAGVLVDRWNRHRVLVATQVLAIIQSALLAALTLTGAISLTSILLLSIFQGFISAIAMPARQSFVIEMVESIEDLPNAIALNSSMVNLARLIGPSAAGILIAVFGEGGCFTIDAISYLAVIASLLMMKLRPQAQGERSHKRLIHELTEGFRYAITFTPVFALLLILALVSLMGMPYMVLLPMIVSERLHEGAALLGYLTAMSGLGALVGVFSVSLAPSIPDFPVFGRHGNDGSACRWKHGLADHRGRKQARMRDELVHHGSCGNGPIWKLVCWLGSRKDRGASCRLDRRSFVHARGVGFLHGFAIHS